MEKRKIFTTLSVGALVISAPVATFAMVGYKNPTEEGDFHIQQYDSQITDEEKLNLIKETIDVQIEHANNLLETTVIVNDEEKEKLKLIINDYSMLESFLDSIDVDELTKEDLREAFFDVKIELNEIHENTRNIIKIAFSKEDRELFQAEFKQKLTKEFNDMKAGDFLLKKEGFHNNGEDRFLSFFTVDEFNLIDKEIAMKLENNELTHKEAIDEIKLTLNNMSQEEKEGITNQIKINHLIERVSDIDEEIATKLENNEITFEQAQELLKEKIKSQDNIDKLGKDFIKGFQKMRLFNN